MSCLVFDIETSALPKEHFDEAQLEYLFRPAENMPDEADRERKREEIGRQFNLWPFTAQCVCICMINSDSGRGKVLYLSEDFEEGPDGPIEYVACMDEAELLSQFWELVAKYNKVCTFNGRGFDVPFLYLRSAALNVPISRKDWLGYRFQTEPHCDLADQFTFYNVGGFGGAARRFNLDFYCKVFGIDSPKAEGVTGMDVNDLMAAGRYKEIAEYCVRDVVATTRLYEIWRDRLAGVK
tara:strand:+ start:64 stop:777 length:714 start_codon:yes stop_codon:yes gene_type:complete